MSKAILLFVGKSACGKTAIANELKTRYGLTQVPSYTTRKPRCSDEVGHIFLDGEKYNSWEAINKDFPDRVAETKFDNEYYFATADQIESNDIYVVDKGGILTFQKRYKGKKRTCVIYIKATCDERIKRMEQRGGKKEDIDRRIVNDIGAFAGVNDLADYIIYNNGDIDTAVDGIYKIWEMINV